MVVHQRTISQRSSLDQSDHSDYSSGPPRTSGIGNCSLGNIETSSRTSWSSFDGRDEIAEVRKSSASETKRVETWRTITTLFLAVTGIVVASSSYWALVRQETKNFDDAYTQFSRSIRDAAQNKASRLVAASRAFGDAISTTATLTNTEWPFYNFFDGIHTFAKHQVETEHLESIQYLTRVQHNEMEAFLKFQEKVYEDWVYNGHVLAYGNTDVLLPDLYQNAILEVTDEGVFPTQDKDEYFPLAYRYPPPNSYFIVNLDIKSINYDDLFNSLYRLKNQTLISNINPYIESDQAEREYHRQFHDQLPGSNASFPHSFMFTPVYEETRNPESPIVAIVSVVVPWDASLRSLLPEDINGLIVVARNSCGQAVTYEIDGINAYFLAWEDVHDRKYDDKEYVVPLGVQNHPDFFETPGHCAYWLSIYPTDTFRDAYISTTPRLFVILVSCTFFLMIAVFFVYDLMVRRRNHLLVVSAARSNELVSSMFPGVLRDKMLKHSMPMAGWTNRSSQMKNVLQGTTGAESVDITDKEPVAELYTDTTVLFADVVGFTSWSSAREPFQVFTLLEMVYQSFDKLARQRKVFKVETVRDSYVAVTGFPDKQSDHAFRMCRFASQCLRTFSKVVARLEINLGPDTGDLGLRIGIHSGQVTAGVLRGERARFQLFGDTVNTAAHIENASEAGRILVSKETADLLIEAGLGNMLVVCDDDANVKGRGILQTSWLSPMYTRSKMKPFLAQMTETSVDLDHSDSYPDESQNDDNQKFDRLINWNVSVLLNLLKKIVARREAEMKTSHSSSIETLERVKELENQLMEDTEDCFLDEVMEIINLPDFDPDSAAKERTANDVLLDQRVESQLRRYVCAVAEAYRNNAFHNFEHASHVAMSTVKLLSRIVAPSELEMQTSPGQKHGISEEQHLASSLHDHTYGITSDPLTQFACVFSAIIHDMDHVGVPNPLLIEENRALGKRYRDRSVAEQNSLELAWRLLMEQPFERLRRTLYQTPEELKRFRELVVNGVMATDISDKELKALRNQRWDKAFNKGQAATVVESERDKVNRKATIVIEHLIQASDVAHTMQHWHVYRKWNKRLFEELYVAWKEGRAKINPADFWAKGEIGFFDFYIIPLAKKLKECGVFGVSSDEYLNYALKNRSEWEVKGEGIVAEMLQELNSKSVALVESS